MIKDTKYIIKRVLIGTGIALLLMLIKATSVNAAELQNNVRFDYPPDKQVENYNDRLYSNFAQGMLDNNTLYSPSGQFSYQERWLDSPTSTNGVITSTTSEQTLFNHNFYLNGLYNNEKYYGTTAFKLINNSWYDSNTKKVTNFPISKGHSYEVLVEIVKADNLTWYSNSDTINLSAESVNVKAWCHSTDCYNAEVVLNNQIHIQQIKWISPSTLNGGKPNTAYFHLRFNFQDVATSDTFYLSSITFDTGNIAGLNYYDGAPYTPFVFNTSSEQGLLQIKSLSLVEDGYINISSPDNDAIGIMPGLDSTSMEDLDLFADYENCDPLDIACHVRNIQTAIQDLIVRVGNFFYNIIESITNFFKWLFVPDFRYIDMYFNNLKTMLQDKFGFLNSSFDLLAYFKDSFLGLEPSTSFSFNGITMPIFNVQIVPAFSFDFSSILENSAINQAYNILYLVLNGLLVLGFVKYCYNSIMDIVGGVSDGIG